jgi:membrane associated rhomboid family serine protease
VEITATVISVAFLSYLAGGYFAGRLARTTGGLNGAMTGYFGAIFTHGVAMPPANFGLAAFVADLIRFLANLIGGFVGGSWVSADGKARPPVRKNL